MIFDFTAVIYLIAGLLFGYGLAIKERTDK